MGFMTCLLALLLSTGALADGAHPAAGEGTVVKVERLNAVTEALPITVTDVSATATPFAPDHYVVEIGFQTRGLSKLAPDIARGLGTDVISFRSTQWVVATMNEISPLLADWKARVAALNGKQFFHDVVVERRWTHWVSGPASIESCEESLFATIKLSAQTLGKFIGTAAYQVREVQQRHCP